MNNLSEFVSKLTWVEYVALIALLRGCWVGSRSGAFLELLRIASYIVTVVVTFQFRGWIAEFLTVNTFMNHATANVVAIVFLFVGVLLFTKLITMLFVKVLKVSESGALNRIIGMFLGASRWLIILSIAFMVVEYLPMEALKNDIKRQSMFGPKIAEIAPTLFDFIKNLSPQAELDLNQPPTP